MIAVASGGLFILAWIFAPRHGRFANMIRRFRLRLQIATDDLLAVIYRREESGRMLMNHGESIVISNGLLGWLTKKRAVRKGWLDSSVLDTESRLQLTPKGREMAQSVVRGHRLWESFLHRDFQLAQDHLHEPAEIAEHFLGPDLQRELSEQLDTPGTDPHGQSIP
jgi:manganese/zinc/iron transport system permease protein